MKNSILNNHMDIDIEEINDVRIQTSSKPVAYTENTTNTFVNGSNIEMEEEPNDSDQNLVQNQDMNVQTGDNAWKCRKDEVLGINFRMEISYDNDPDHQEIFITICDKVINLLNAWIKPGGIAGVHDKDHQIVKDNLQDNINDWGIDPRIIAKKQLITVDLCLQLNTKKTTFQLCQSKKRECEKYCIKLETKKTEMECTKRIGFIANVYAQEASQDYYTKELIDHGSKVLGVPADGTLEV